MNGADGGFARYTLTIAPWTDFLALGRDSRVFQNKSVFEILDIVFGAYRGQGKLVPAWRYDLVERALDAHLKKGEIIAGTLGIMHQLVADLFAKPDTFYLHCPQR
ncbi:hypothetical protein AAKU55_000889 [Oxalobacteraceae bacterium GrIS 1.11]